MMTSVVIPNEQASQIEIKPKIEIVKFGWIIGVLVCLRFYLFFSIEIFVS